MYTDWTYHGQSRTLAPLQHLMEHVKVRSLNEAIAVIEQLHTDTSIKTLDISGVFPAIPCQSSPAKHHLTT